MSESQGKIPPADPVTMQIIEVIVVETLRGAGISADDPVRRVQSYFTRDGALLVEIDAQRYKHVSYSLADMLRAQR